MAVNISAYSGGVPIRVITEAILAEYRKQSFKGLIILGAEKPTVVHTSLSSALSSYADLKCFSSESLAGNRKNSGILIEASGIADNLTAKLSTATGKHGHRNSAVLLRRTREVCTPPARSGYRKKLSADDLRNIIRRWTPRINYSEELGLKYFNYREETKINFVLFDDAFTFKRKIALCRSMGIDNIFFIYSEVSDMISELEKLRTTEFR